MLLKTNLLCGIAIISIIYISSLPTANGFCSLEKMKKFAVEACEHLFPNDEPSSVRNKREFHHRSKSNELGFESHKKKHIYAVRRSSYPKGGYLKVSEHHFEHLSQLNVFPMYKSHSNKKQDSDRHKRDAYNGYVGLPYCCYHKCDEDFFCR